MAKPPTSQEIKLPQWQRVLLLHAVKDPYVIEEKYSVPVCSKPNEVLIKTSHIGLNPIDWKAPDFGWGIPTLPYVAGRELVSEIADAAPKNSLFQRGDKVIVVSTEYRDLRKAAYQEYVVANVFNIAKLPTNISQEQGASIGVAYSSAVIILGICIGLNFSELGGPDLLHIVRRSTRFQSLAGDIRAECTTGIKDDERAQRGDWLAIWGGSSTCAYIINQLARLAGLRTIMIVDMQKHGAMLYSSPSFQADVVVDSHDPSRAIEIVRSVTNGSLRFAVDVIGRSSAEYLLECINNTPLKSLKRKRSVPDGSFNVVEPTPPATPTSNPLTSPKSSLTTSHLIGVVKAPKGLPPPNVKYHMFPVKLFHEVPEVGYAAMDMLEMLLANGSLVPPRIIDVVDGLEGINGGLDRMRKGEISAGRLVAKLR